MNEYFRIKDKKAWARKDGSKVFLTSVKRGKDFDHVTEIQASKVPAGAKKISKKEFLNETEDGSL